MKMTIDDIKSLIGETSDYDKKQQLEPKKVKSWCKSVSAFANGKGGKLIFGIEDGTDRIVGLEDAQWTAEKFSEVVKDRIDPVPEIELSIESVEGKSPGGMYDVTPVQDHDLMHVKSRRRNPVLADIFSRLRYMERRGSGFKKICDNYSIQPHYRDELRPTFYSDQSDFVLTLPNLNYDRKNGEVLSSPIVPQSSPKFPKVQ